MISGEEVIVRAAMRLSYEKKEPVTTYMSHNRPRVINCATALLPLS